MRLASHNEYSWSAFWLLGADFRSVGWPFCGEVEITEMWVTKVSWDNAVGKAMVPRTSPFPVAVIALPPRLLRACSVRNTSRLHRAQVPCLTAHTSNAPPPVGGWDGRDKLRWVAFNEGGYDQLVRDGKVDPAGYNVYRFEKEPDSLRWWTARHTHAHALTCMMQFTTAATLAPRQVVCQRRARRGGAAPQRRRGAGAARAQRQPRRLGPLVRARPLEAVRAANVRHL